MRSADPEWHLVSLQANHFNMAPINSAPRFRKQMKIQSCHHRFAGGQEPLRACRHPILPAILLATCCALSLTLADLAAGAQVVSNTLTYYRATAFTEHQGIGQLRLSGDGSRIVFATGSKKIFTMNSDGSGLSEIFDYAAEDRAAPFVTPFVDISHDGARVIWTDTSREVFVADFDGGNRLALATEFPRPDGLGTVGPEIPTAPVLSPDGQHVYFANSLGRGLFFDWSTSAGIYHVKTDGSELQLRFSYADLASAIFGTTGSEYNINIAFSGLDVSDDGSRFLVSTGQEGGAIASWDGSTFHSLNGGAVSSARRRTLSISGDGTLAAYVVGGSPIVRSNAFAGGQERELWNLGGLNTASLEFNQDGSRLIADGWGTGNAPQVRLLHADGSWRLDLAPRRQSFFSEHVSISSSGSRSIWLSGFDDPNGVSQIWVCDIDPANLGTSPVITNPTMDPDYLLLDGSNTTVISADIGSATSPITHSDVDALLDGEMQFRVIGGFVNPLIDDGLNNDAVAGDGRFTSADIRRDAVNAIEATYTLRLAAFTDDEITAIDVRGLRMSDGLPEELADTDDDGLTDLLERAFGTDPSSPDASAGEPVVVADRDTTGPLLTLTYRRHPDGTLGPTGEYLAGGFIYSIESSRDLRNWKSIDDQIVSVETTPVDGVERATVRLPVALLGDASRYLRIVVARDGL